MPTTNEPAASPQRFVPSEESLRMALAAARAGIWEWHLDTGRHAWSEEIWPLYGLDRSVVASHDNWLASIHPDDKDGVCEAIESVRQARLCIELQWRTHPDSGPVRWLLSRGEPRCDVDDGRTIYAGIVMDITDGKRAEHKVLQLTESLEDRVKQRTAALTEHERLLQSILDSVPGPVGYWTPDLINRYANKTCCEWFDMSPEQVRNCHIKDLLGPDAFARSLPYMERALAGERQRFERSMPVPGKHGQVRHTEVHYLPDIVGGVVKGFLAIIFDISQIKQAELAAEAANLAKSEFLANISHEVRTPLNAMFGLAQVGARQAAGTQLTRTFEQILDSAQHLLALVNDVLDFSKIESGKLNLLSERFNLAQVIEHVLALKSIRAQAKGLALSLIESSSVPQYCHGDATRIAQILLNLISNAIKFTQSGGVAIRLDYQAPMLTIEVSDTGCGMNDEQLGQLFKPFVQVHRNQASPEGGTGLGLAICKKLTEMMKGDITVTSEPARGSVFTATLSLLQPEAADFRPLRQLTLIGLPPRDMAMLRIALQDRGCQVLEASYLPDVRQAETKVLVIAAQAMPYLPEDELRAHISAGHTIVVNSAASTALNLPADLQNDMAVVAGPLSPLRVLNAVNTKLSRAPVATNRRLEGLHVLAAEDNPVNRLVLGQMLEQEGATVTFAFDGAHALEQVRVQGAASFDIMLCDIQMPILDGYQTAEALGNIAPSLPIIGLTAHAFDTAKQQARRSGMVGYITKPYMLDTLVEEIRRYARRRPGQQAAPSQTSLTTDHPSDQPTMQPDITDWQAMQQYFESQPQLLDRLIGMLSGTLTAIQQELRNAISTRDMDALAKVAHNIKGTALNLHTPELARLAVQTQEQARQVSQSALDTADALAHKLQAFIDMAALHQAGGASKAHE